MSFETPGTYDQRLLPSALEDRLVGWLARASGGALVLLVGAAWVALVTWTVSDPSLTHATGGAVKNALGYPGAVVSDLMLQTIGLATPLALIAPTLWAIEMLTRERVRDARSKLTFYPLSVLVLAGGLSALPTAAGWPLNHGYGGILGDLVYGLGASLFGLLNPDRGGLAAGLTLLVAGTASLMTSVGVEIADVADAVRRWRTPARRDATAADDVMDDGAPTDDALSRDAPAPPAVSGKRANPRSRWLALPALGALWRRHRPTDPHLRAPDDAAASPHWSQGLAPTAHDPALAERHPYPPSWGTPGPAGQGQALLRDPSALDPHRLPVADPRWPVPPPAMPPAPPMPSPYGPRHAHAPAAVEPAFDHQTDAASRAMAARFAPPGAQVQPTAMQPSPGHAAPDVVAAVDSERPGPPPRPRSPAPPPPGWPMPAGSAPAARPPHPQAASVAAPAAAPRPAAPTPPPAAAAPRGFGSGLLGGLAMARPAPQYKRPSLNLLKRPSGGRSGADFTPAMQRGTARLLEDVLADFGVKGAIKDIRPGPVVTSFELEPARGTKSSRVIGLADDIARSMSATSARIAIVPGRNAIGIELPNTRREPVLLRELLESEAYRSSDAALPITLGKGIGGEPMVADLARMPHLLVAGTTGSGKSVGVNAMILSLLFRHGPEDCRFLMIDPKMLELSVYNGIPHLLAPVVTDPAKALAALNWAVREMEERYKRMAQLAVRNIDVFNNRVRNARKRGELIGRTVQTGFDQRTGQPVYENEQLKLEPLPYIVIVVDEFADLMAVAGKEIEGAVQRLAQMARAAGIHLVMATQRPSVDVVTGTIKANFPSRISFKVASKIDSRTILGDQGAEQLLGQGDMLFSTSGGSAPQRVHGAFVADDEVEAIVAHLRTLGEPRYVDGITDEPDPADAAATSGEAASDDDLYDRAVAIVMRDGKASTSYLQRRLSIGYNRAADLIERMETEGLISAANAVGKRDILAARGG